MIRPVFAAAFLALLLPGPRECGAQENAGPARRIKAVEPSASQELQAVRQLLEQQSRQLETLTQQVAKLAQLIEAKHNLAATSPAPIVIQNMPLQETNPPAPAGNPLGGVPVATPAAPEAQKAEGSGGHGTMHTVAKGETLTSIARQYKISISELQKINKIENDRKLQIGQTLIVPQAKAADTPPEKKEQP